MNELKLTCITLGVMILLAGVIYLGVLYPGWVALGLVLIFIFLGLRSFIKAMLSSEDNDD